MDTVPNDLIGTREAARILRAHLSLIHRMIADGRLPAYRRQGGERYLVSRGAVEALLVRVVPAPEVVLDQQIEERYARSMARLKAMRGKKSLPQPDP